MADPATPPVSLHGTRRKTIQSLIKVFFGGNAMMAVIILALICIFLLKEGTQFFPMNHKELVRYRQCGLEFVDYIRENETEHNKLSSLLNRAFFSQVNEKAGTATAKSDEALERVNAVKDALAPTWQGLVDAWDMEPAAPAVIATKKSDWQTAVKSWWAKAPQLKNLTEAEAATLGEEVASLEDENASPATLKRLQEEASDRKAAVTKELAIYQTTSERFEAAIDPISGLLNQMKRIAVANKEASNVADTALNKKTQLERGIAETRNEDLRKQLQADLATVSLVPVDFAARVKPLLDKRAEYAEKQAIVVKEVEATAALVPDTGTNAESTHLLSAFHRAFPLYLEGLKKTPAKLAAWDFNKPVPAVEAVTAFLFGRNWITGGSWQDFYGVLPLFFGSLLICFIALVIAIPFGVGSAIFVNQFATPTERNLIKPSIEFIQAIPSVVLGFLGISVIGESLRDWSHLHMLQWVPGFPIAERLNAFTAGVLLGLMAIPTIFTLAEDSINNVPGAYLEAAEAMGSTKLQTVFRVIVPSAFSGIIAAVLLGLGRVIGETMVVLLVAGNRIQIPDFITHGLGVFFQPVHTLTGIIAQELGEVPPGSLHYRALFIVGVLLFFIALAINGTAQYVLKKYKAV